MCVEVGPQWDAGVELEPLVWCVVAASHSAAPRGLYYLHCVRQGEAVGRGETLQHAPFCLCLFIFYLCTFYRVILISGAFFVAV